MNATVENVPQDSCHMSVQCICFSFRSSDSRHKPITSFYDFNIVLASRVGSYDMSLRISRYLETDAGVALRTCQHFPSCPSHSCLQCIYVTKGSMTFGLLKRES